MALRNGLYVPKIADTPQGVLTIRSPMPAVVIAPARLSAPPPCADSSRNRARKMGL
jgi:hypothetical protein